MSSCRLCGVNKVIKQISEREGDVIFEVLPF